MHCEPLEVEIGPTFAPLLQLQIRDISAKTPPATTTQTQNTYHPTIALAVSTSSSSVTDLESENLPSVNGELRRWVVYDRSPHAHPLFSELPRIVKTETTPP